MAASPVTEAARAYVNVVYNEAVDPRKRVKLVIVDDGGDDGRKYVTNDMHTFVKLLASHSVAGIKLKGTFTPALAMEAAAALQLACSSGLTSLALKGLHFDSLAALRAFCAGFMASLPSGCEVTIGKKTTLREVASMPTSELEAQLHACVREGAVPATDAAIPRGIKTKVKLGGRSLAEGTGAAVAKLDDATMHAVRNMKIRGPVTAAICSCINAALTRAPALCDIKFVRFTAADDAALEGVAGAICAFASGMSGDRACTLSVKNKAVGPPVAMPLTPASTQEEIAALLRKYANASEV